MERGGLGPSSDSDVIEDDPANAMKLRQRVKLLELELKRIRTHLANLAYIGYALCFSFLGQPAYSIMSVFSYACACRSLNSGTVHVW